AGDVEAVGRCGGARRMTEAMMPPMTAAARAESKANAIDAEEASNFGAVAFASAAAASETWPAAVSRARWTSDGVACAPASVASAVARAAAESVTPRRARMARS